MLECLGCLGRENVFFNQIVLYFFITGILRIQYGSTVLGFFWKGKIEYFNRKKNKIYSYYRYITDIIHI